MKEKKEMTVEQLLNGKELIVAGKKYLPTKEYVEPFLDKMSKYTDTFLVKARTPNIITSDIENIGYSRVLVQAVLNDKIDNHQNVIGLLYGLDTRVPIAKIYSGAINCACTNLCVFNPSEITVQEMTHQRINYSMTADSLKIKKLVVGSVKVEPQIPLFITYYTLYPFAKGVVSYPDVYGFDGVIFEHLRKYL